jgi:Spy/CpxP family protein refolding chaperone
LKAKNVTGEIAFRSLATEAQKLRSKEQQKYRLRTMKRNLLTIAAAGAIALGGFAIAQAQGGPGGHGRGHALSLEQLTKTYNLTSDQQAKIKPLLDQARPQIIAIHKDAMQKIQTVVDGTMSQIRPLLTSTQQTKFDAVQKAKQDMRSSMQELHSAMQQ